MKYLTSVIVVNIYLLAKYNKIHIIMFLNYLYYYISNNYKKSKIEKYFIIFVSINLIIITSYYNDNYKTSLGFQISFLNLKSAFAIEDINYNNTSNFANKYNATSINELVNKD